MANSGEPARIIIQYVVGTHEHHEAGWIGDDDLLNLELRINTFLNGPLSSVLRADERKWSQIVAAEYAFGDSHQALAVFPLIDASAAPVGVVYLLLRGLLQEMLIQHDALMHFAEALEFEDVVGIIRAHPDLKFTREYRNRIAGHPTRKDRPKGEPTSFHLLRRHGISTKEFRFARYDDDATSARFETVRTQDLIDRHLTAYREILLLLCERLGTLAAEYEDKTAEI